MTVLVLLGGVFLFLFTVFGCWLYCETLRCTMDDEPNPVDKWIARRKVEKSGKCAICYELENQLHLSRSESAEKNEKGKGADERKEIKRLKRETLEANREAWKAVQEMVTVARDLTLAEQNNK